MDATLEPEVLLSKALRTPLLIKSIHWGIMVAID